MSVCLIELQNTQLQPFPLYLLEMFASAGVTELCLRGGGVIVMKVSGRRLFWERGDSIARHRPKIDQLNDID